MKFIKTLIFLSVVACLTFFVVSCAKSETPPENESGLTFSLNADKSAYVVTGVGDNNDYDLDIPSAYNGKPVVEIGENAFKSTFRLVEITFPDSVTKIGNTAFANCSNLLTVNFGDGVVEIGEGAFSSCPSLTELNFGQNVKKIGDMAFYECDDIQVVSFNDKLEDVGVKAFYNCLSLTEINFSTSLNYIRDNAFENCKALQEIYIPDEAPVLIGNQAFYYCSAVQTIYIGNSATAIGIEAFEMNRTAYKITIGDSVTHINERAFETCRKVTTLTLGESVSYIANGAFANCYLLLDVYNRSNIELELGSKTNGWVAYYALNVYDDASGSKVSVTDDGCILYTDGIDVKILGHTSTQSFDLIVPEGVTEIAKLAFYNNEYIVNATFPSTLNHIGAQAFHFAYTLQNLNLGSTAIIDERAFANCTLLRTVTISSSLSEIADNVFMSCTRLKNINFYGSTQQWNNISVSQTGNELLLGATVNFIN